jgi:hypothetical protein
MRRGMSESPAASTPAYPNCPRSEQAIRGLREEAAELWRQSDRDYGDSSLPPQANRARAFRMLKNRPGGCCPAGQPAAG